MAGEAAYLPLTPELFCLRKHKLLMSLAQQLAEIAALENKLTKHEIELHGKVLEFYTNPMTISEFQAAKKASKNPEDTLETTARLFIKKALDESGMPLLGPDALPLLLGKGDGKGGRGLSMASAAKLMGAMGGNDEEEEAEEMDMKSAKKGAK